MFSILFIIDELGFYQAGIIFSINVFLISILDFPTGGIADTIGYRTVMLISYVFYILFFYFLIQAEVLLDFIFAIVFYSIAIAQESGALESWFDNNYKQSVGETDSQRIHYGDFQGKRRGIGLALSGIFFVIGGVIAQTYSRKFLFGMNIILLLLILLFIQFGLRRPHDELSDSDLGIQDAKSGKSYLKTLKDGIDFVIADTHNFFYFLGFSLTLAATTAWAYLFVFPVYNSYSAGRDDLTSVFRSILFISSIPFAVLAGKISKRINLAKNIKLGIIITFAFNIPIYFFGIYLYFIFSPPHASFHLASFLGLIVWILVITSIAYDLGPILIQKFEIDYFPDEQRNSLLSLRSSVISLLSFPLQISGGWIAENYSLETGVLYMSVISLVGVAILSLGLLLGRDNSSLIS
jgi:MFS family permease